MAKAHFESKSLIPVSLFSKRLEFFNLLLPFIFLLIGLLEINLQWSLTSLQTQWLTFITKIILLNHTHIYLTFIMLFYFPEFNAWRKNRGSNSVLNWTIVFLGFWLMINVLIPNLQTSQNSRILAKLLWEILIIYAIHHVVAQSLGLSLAYNHQIIKTSEAEKARQAALRAVLMRSEKIERFSIWLSFVLVVLYRIGQFFLVNSKWRPVLNMLPVISFLVLAGMIYSCYRLTIFSGHHKTIFLFRTLLIPLSAFSLFALLGYQTVHGIEYLLTFKNAAKNSKFIRTATASIFLQIGFFVFIGVFIALFRYPPVKAYAFNIASGFDQYLQFFIGLSITATHMHYFWDGQMFRMRDANTRENIGPLLDLRNS